MALFAQLLGMAPMRTSEMFHLLSGTPVNLGSSHRAAVGGIIES
jgi:hypothetical protein